MCFNRRVLIGLALAAVAIFVVAGRSGTAFLPLLVVLACPLSMVAMMFGMRGGNSAKACHTTPSAADDDPEVVRLRAELNQLRERPLTSPPSAAGGGSAR